MSARRVELIAVGADDGQRLDKFLTEHLPGVGRQQAAELCASGRVRVDGRRSKKSSLVSAGAQIRVELDEAEPVQAEPELALELRLEQTRVRDREQACWHAQRSAAHE